uniref:Uncharacterized threonine-rich GPI-anchored glycoprotein PJ4664.02-like n=1 Tax=Callorhinchus milii TaxID=7868 RepID=A0A4W3H7F0_CALMI
MSAPSPGQPSRRIKGLLTSQALLCLLLLCVNSQSGTTMTSEASTASSKPPTTSPPTTPPPTTSPPTTLPPTTKRTTTSPPTTTTTKPTSTSKAPSAVNKCQNGGTWTGTECKCVSPFIGKFCESASETVKVENVTNTFGASVKIGNEEFKPAMADNQSTEFKNFTRDFKNQMDQIYGNIDGYDKVIVKELRKGSIVVDHEIMFVLPPEKITEDFISNTQSSIQDELEASSSGNFSFQINSSFTTVKFEKSDADGK